MGEGLSSMNSSENSDILGLITDVFKLPDNAINTYSPLNLAYIGDSIYALVIKTVLVKSGNCPAKLLHNRTVKYVKASAQAEIADFLRKNELLSDEELDILRRGRNAKSATIAKNATVDDYRHATGLEALIGYLYLKGQFERLLTLLKAGFEHIDSLGDKK